MVLKCEPGKVGAGLPAGTDLEVADGGRRVSPDVDEEDCLGEILFGKRPVGDLDNLVRDWRSNGGDTIRSEYEQALQQAQG